MPRLLKTAQYKNGRPTNGTEFGTVVYDLDRSRCVFTGLTPDGSSTILAAQGIIWSIATAEARDTRSIAFFDLQTHRGYWRMEPGEYAYDQLVIVHSAEREEGIDVRGWQSAECPRYIKELFRSYIGALIGVLTPQQARAGGYEPSTPHAVCLDELQSYRHLPEVAIVVNDADAALLAASGGRRFTLWYRTRRRRRNPVD